MGGSEENRLWSRLGRLAPWLGTPGLLKAVVLLNALTFLLVNLEPAYAGVLKLDPAKILEGELWRLVTYIFIPQTESWFWIFFLLMFMWFLAGSLEEHWGALKLNTFYLLGMTGCTIAAFFFGGGSSNTFLNLSLFFAFATIAPNYEIFLFLIVRVKVKYIAWVLAGIYLLQFALLPLSAKMAMVASMANYLLFFAPSYAREVRARRRSEHRLREFQAGTPESVHQCRTCQRTEISHPELDFRVAADGEEYCIEHLPGRN